MFALGSAAHAQTTCNRPSAPNAPPDGSSATKDEMIAGNKAIKTYKSDMDEYLSCVSAKIDAIPDADPKTLKGAEKTAAEQNMKQKQQLAKEHDAALDEEKANADRFNAQLRIWNAKNAKQ